MTRFVRYTGALAALLPLALALPQAAVAEWVRDEVRINLRTGPGTKYRIEATLSSGDRVSVLSEEEKWTQVRLENGTEGWVPKGYIEKSAPASVRLPKAEAELEKASAEIADLRATLAEQREAVLELERLRERNETLEIENVQVSGAARWRSMGMGALIVLTGMLIGMGVLSFAGRASTARGRRIKL